MGQNETAASITIREKAKNVIINKCNLSHYQHVSQILDPRSVWSVIWWFLWVKIKAFFLLCWLDGIFLSVSRVQDAPKALFSSRGPHEVCPDRAEEWRHECILLLCGRRLHPTINSIWSLSSLHKASSSLWSRCAVFVQVLMEGSRVLSTPLLTKHFKLLLSLQHFAVTPAEPAAPDVSFLLLLESRSDFNYLTHLLNLWKLLPDWNHK